MCGSCYSYPVHLLQQPKEIYQAYALLAIIIMAATTAAAAFHLFNPTKGHSSIDSHASICLKLPPTFYRVPTLPLPSLRAINLHGGPFLTKSQSKLFTALQESVLLSSEEKEQEENDEDKNPKEKQENTDDPKQESTPPVPNTKLYVKSLPYSCDTKEITEMFQQCGTVVSAEFINSKETGKSKGFAFVTMSTVEEAGKAIEKFHEFEMGGRSLSVIYAKIESKRLFPDRRSRDEKHSYYVDSPHKVHVSNLAWTVNSQSLGEFFKGCANVLGAKVIYEPKTGKSHGHGFVSFASKDDAIAAIASLNGKDLEDRPIQLSIFKQALANKKTPKD